MRGKKLSIGLTAILGIFAVTSLVIEASAGTIKVLHEFNGKDGYQPNGVIFDASGNLYGTNTFGGAVTTCVNGVSFGCGTVFKLAPTGDGSWKETVLYIFGGNDADGAIWPGAPLRFDSAGNLYSTFEVGGTNGTGGVFEMSPTGNGGWNLTVIYSLSDEQSGVGSYPSAPVIFDAAGNIYSTVTGNQILGGIGSVFELTPIGGGSWTETTLLYFDRTDGLNPYDSVIFDASGNLYGTAYQTYQGDAYGGGTVFELTPIGGGSWAETTLYTFDKGGSESNPYDQGGLVFDSAANLYGTTQNGGYFGMGTVFELSPAAGGSWTEKVLLSFNGNDGSGPTAGVTFDASGNLYGETLSGGSDNDGVVFKLSPAEAGRWTETILHSFNGMDGSGPWQGLIFDAAGNLYGTAQAGGKYGDGTVFEITP
ncbi:MAG: choice-of-anchor tandem repeat GloVer-containing protein [Candidatus Sulfotelmatobacter sp.]|jgi:uncharacterized repeat protein (TIGR03803 family)